MSGASRSLGMSLICPMLVSDTHVNHYFSISISLSASPPVSPFIGKRFLFGQNNVRIDNQVEGRDHSRIQTISVCLFLLFASMEQNINNKYNNFCVNNYLFWSQLGQQESGQSATGIDSIAGRGLHVAVGHSIASDR